MGLLLAIMLEVNAAHGRYWPTSPAPLLDVIPVGLHTDVSAPGALTTVCISTCSVKGFRWYCSSIWAISLIQRDGQINVWCNKCWCMSMPFAWKWLGNKQGNLGSNFERIFVVSGYIYSHEWQKIFFCLKSGVVTDRPFPEILIFLGKNINITFSATPNYFGLETCVA